MGVAGALLAGTVPGKHSQKHRRFIDERVNCVGVRCPGLAGSAELAGQLRYADTQRGSP